MKVELITPAVAKEKIDFSVKGQCLIHKMSDNPIPYVVIASGKHGNGTFEGINISGSEKAFSTNWSCNSFRKPRKGEKLIITF